jgi:hypothetical protein
VLGNVRASEVPCQHLDVVNIKGTAKWAWAKSLPTRQRTKKLEIGKLVVHTNGTASRREHRADGDSMLPRAAVPQNQECDVCHIARSHTAEALHHAVDCRAPLLARQWELFERLTDRHHQAEVLGNCGTQALEHVCMRRGFKLGTNNVQVGIQVRLTNIGLGSPHMDLSCLRMTTWTITSIILSEP